MNINIEMTSSRPYLLRALNEWIVDNDLTPHIVVDAQQDNVVVPTQYVEKGKIVLNISPGAVSGFNISNDYISFSARFSGKSMEIFVPISAVQALYAKENGQGMVFNEEKSTPQEAPESARTKPTAVKTESVVVSKKEESTRPRLKLVD